MGGLLNVDHHMAADLARAQFLRLGRKAKERIDFSFGKKFRGGRIHYPIDVLERIEPDIGSHRREERMLLGTQALYAYLLALQVANAVDLFIGEQFEAADMHAGQHRDGFTGINCGYDRRREVQR